MVDAAYFDSLHLSIADGRPFTDRDGSPGEPNVLVNQRFADVHFPAGDALGKRLQLSAPGADAASPWLTIVGVTPTIRQWASDDGEPLVYQPLSSNPPATGMLLIRVPSGDPAAAAPAVREAVRQLDANVPIFRLSTLEGAIVDANWNGRVSHRIILTISTIALVLALLGQIAVTAQSVTQRTQEIGLRIAVGADAWSILRLVLRRALVQVTAGLGLGIFLLFALSRFFPVPSSFEDARVLAATAAAIASAALAACLVPAVRAARIDPVAALRAE
jgi:hypothetical protein